ncbi:MAG: insulinase family protein [Clostridia bacterium]|nr:insulinase family protein [Clostridia bacterium]
MKTKVYKNGALLLYRKRRRKKATAVVAGFIYGNNRTNYPEPTAHFCEHMFFNETETKDKTALKDAQLNTFASYNGRTSLWWTEIDFFRANSALEPCFQLASEMLLKTKFAKEVVDNEKGVIKQELVRRLTNTNSKFSFARLRTLYKKHGNPTSNLGSAEEIDAMTPEDLQRFRDDCFISQNFFIAIDGGISFAKAKKLAEKHFINQLKSNPAYPVEHSVTFGAFDQKGNLLVEEDTIKKSMCTITFNLDIPEDETKDTQTAKLLCQITNHLKGKLHSILRDEKGLVYSANMYYDSQKDQPCIGFNFECSNENTNKVIDEIGKLLQEYRTQPFETSLLDLHKHNTILAEDESQPRPIYPSRWFAEYFIFGEEIFTKKYKKTRKKAYQALTPEDLLTFCQKAFSKPSNLYVTIMSNAPAETFYDYKTMQDILVKGKTPKKKSASTEKPKKQPTKLKQKASKAKEKTATASKAATSKKTTETTKASSAKKTVSAKAKKAE